MRDAYYAYKKEILIEIGGNQMLLKKDIAVFTTLTYSIKKQTNSSMRVGARTKLKSERGVSARRVKNSRRILVNPVRIQVTCFNGRWNTNS